MRSLFVYWKQPPAAAQASLAQLRSLHAAWAEQAGQNGTAALQARLYQRPQADAQGRVTCMATYHATGGLGDEQEQAIAQALQATLPGCHIELFDELAA